ncbi:rlx protein [Clostridiales bacterium]|nr:rlx protein [Clostridiales bacterium]
MAILKHIASKNADYGKALRYLMFQHDEFTQKPLRDSAGNMRLREEFHLDGINCDPFTFDVECEQLNEKWKKNQAYNEIKSHHYVISFDPKDRSEHDLTGEKAQRLGLEYAKKNFPGHQTLVCTHMDGNNGSGNIHVHIVINSLRKFDVERKDFMERPCDSRAGNKHHLTKKYLAHLKRSVMGMCRREGLCQVDLLAPSEKKVSEKEHWAARRGQKELDQRNQQMTEDGITPRKTKYQTQKQFLRDAIEDASHTARSMEEFQEILSGKYRITLKESRGRFSYLHPERSRPITSRQLGMNYEKEQLLRLIDENAHEGKPADHRPAGEGFSMRLAKPFPPSARILDIANDESMSILFVKSDLSLVKDLQSCVKARQSQAYAQKVKLSNLKEMAKTVAYVQEHGYDTREGLEDSLAMAKERAAAARKTLKATEDELREINRRIRYTGQYLANKAVYTEFCKSRNKGKFRREHSAEITLYETARRFLKEDSSDRKPPSLKLLREKKAEFLEQRKVDRERYHRYRDHQKELGIVCSNVNMILGERRARQVGRGKEHHIL